jgi:acetyl-CoA synthetase
MDNAGGNIHIMNNRPSFIHKSTEDVTVKPNLLDYVAAAKDFNWETAANEELSFFNDGTLNIAHNCIDRHAESDKKDKVALIFQDEDGDKEEYTFLQLKDDTNKFANLLQKHKVLRGDRVFIFLPTVPERYVAFLGTLKVGAIVGTMFAAFQEMALLDRLSDSQASVVVTDKDLYPRIQKIQKDLPELRHIIVVDHGVATMPNAENVIDYDEIMSQQSNEFTVAHMKRDDLAYMLYTSGTTGKPKGVVHAHNDILQAIITSRYVLDIHDNDVYWCTADLGWVTGVVYGVLGVWGLGGTSVIYEGRFSPDNWYHVLQDNNVSIWYSAPTAIRMLMGSKQQPQDYDLSALRHLCSVGEPLNPEAIWWALETFGMPFHDTWWQTELGGISITNYPSLDIKPGSMGKPLPGIEAAIIDEDGNPVDIGEEGNLALKASTVSSLMKTIWHNTEKFDSYFKNEWYISGDCAVKDADGYYWFVGRTDDVINTAGERIGPFEVESALVEYPAVIEAAVIGKPDETRGEIIKAFVVLKKGVVADDTLKETLKQYVKQNLAGHAYPREISFIDKLPKTRSGKIMRRVLKAQELGLPVGDTSTLENF